MGACSSKIHPDIYFNVLFEELEDNMKILHNMYNTVIRDNILTTGVFRDCIKYDTIMTEKRHTLEKMIHNRNYIVYEYQLNEIKMEQLNALLTFKTNILQRYISKEFIIENDLLDNVDFTSFLTILPNKRRNSYNRYISVEKDKTDADIYDTIVISNTTKRIPKEFANKYDKCPHCNHSFTQGSSLSIVKRINTDSSTPVFKFNMTKSL